MQKSKKGHNTAMRSPTEKKTRGPFVYIAHLSAEGMLKSAVIDDNSF